MPGMALHHTGRGMPRACSTADPDVRIHHRIPIVERTRLSCSKPWASPRHHEDARRAETLLCLGENVFDSRLVP